MRTKPACPIAAELVERTWPACYKRICWPAGYVTNASRPGHTHTHYAAPKAACAHGPTHARLN